MGWADRIVALVPAKAEFHAAPIARTSGNGASSLVMFLLISHELENMRQGRHTIGWVLKYSSYNHYRTDADESSLTDRA